MSNQTVQSAKKRCVKALRYMAIASLVASILSGATLLNPSQAEAQTGCDQIVPENQLSMPTNTSALFWRYYGPGCAGIKRVDYEADGSHFARGTVIGAYNAGVAHCVTVNTQGGSGPGTLVSIARAAAFCAEEYRGWAYVRLV